MVNYGTWRTDKPASEGYSHELVSDKTPKEYYDNLSAIYGKDETNTILKLFRKMVDMGADEDYLGTRDFE